MRRKVHDFTEGCAFCSDDEAPLQNYYGDMLCQDCIKMERETNWDEYERKRRQRIEEQNEY